MKTISFEDSPIAMGSFDHVPDRTDYLDQLWLLRDRRNPKDVRRLYVPNAAMAERAAKTMLAKNPEVQISPDDFCLIHVADVFLDHEDYGVCFFQNQVEVIELKEFVNAN